MKKYSNILYTLYISRRLAFPAQKDACRNISAGVAMSYASSGKGGKPVIFNMFARKASHRSPVKEKA